MTDSVRKRILLVEDEALLAITQKKQLEEYGYIVKTVSTGEKAVEAVQASDFDLLLMDINLGKGIDGTEAAEIIVQERDIPIVFLSSHTDPEVVEKTEKITSYGYVVKSSSITVLDASIKMAFKLFDTKQVLSAKEEALRYKHEFMSYVIEHNRSAIAVHDRDLKYLYVSRQYLDSYRVNERDVIGRHHYEVFPDLPKKWRDAHQKALRGEVSSAENDPFEREDGTTVVTRWECRPWYEQEGTIGGIIVYTEVITEKKQTERKLAENVKLLSRAQEIAHIGNWRLDVTANRLWWSDEIYRMFGCEPQEFAATYEAFLDFIHPDDRAAVDSAYTRSVQEGKDGYEIEHRIVRRDSGDVRYVHERCDHERDDSGTIIQSIGMVQDITDRKQSEQELTGQKQYLEGILETTPDGFWVVNPDRKITNVNTAYCRMSGYSADELTRMEINDLDAIETPQETAARLQRIMENGSETFETKHRRKDTSVFDVEVSASRLDREDGMHLVCFCRDITQRRKIRQELEESQKQYRTLVDRSPNIIYLFGTKSGGIFWSEATRRILGIDPKDVVRDSFLWNRSIHPDDKETVDEALTGAISRNPFDIEYRIQATDGRWVWLRDRLIDRREENGDIIIQGHAEDITDRKEAEMEIQKQLTEKEVLLREVHHRVKNNIATIESLLSLQAGSTAHAVVKAALQDTISRVQGMRVLYDRLLMNKELREVSSKNYAENLIDSIATVFDSGKNVTIEKHISDFEIDAGKAFTIGIILNELLTNVFKYAFGDSEDGLVSVSIEKDDNEVTLVIKDDGIGFDERALQNKAPGFGLTIVKMLTEQLQGTITFKNDNGTHTILEFPITVEQ